MGSATPQAVRVQLPAGPAFAAAHVEAADRYASRRDLDDARRKVFGTLVVAALDTVSSCAPTSVELVMTELDASISVEVIGVGAKQTVRISDSAVLANAAAEYDVTASDATVAFRVGLG